MTSADGNRDICTDESWHDRLIEAVARDRDRDAFAALFDHYAPRLKAWMIRSGVAPAAAEDFAQDTMLTVWRKADLYNAQKARAATWIFTIARNRRLDMLRRDARTPPAPELELSFQDAPPAQPDEILSSNQDAERIRQAMQRLNPEQAEALQLAFFHEHPHSEIARRLDLPLGTVKSRIRNAMIRLRQTLDETHGAGR